MPHKGIRGEETNRSSQEPEWEDHDEWVAKVQQTRNKILNFQLQGRERGGEGGGQRDRERDKERQREERDRDDFS